MPENPNKPVLVTPFPNEQSDWTCPITNLTVPLEKGANLRYRRELLLRANDDDGLQAAIYTACSKSLLYWASTMVWAQRIFYISEEGKQTQTDSLTIPFIPWEFQREYLLDLQYAIINGESRLTEKYRDAGATICHTIAIHHEWLFKAERLILEISRVESDVDDSENPRSLFVKHDIINKFLPSWMRPKIKTTKLHRINQSNGSRIDGESSNKAAGSGARVHILFLDEFSKAENATKIRSSTADVAACRLVNGTAFGAGTEFSKWAQDGTVKVRRLDWWDHPEKGAGREVVWNETNKTWKVTSPWFKHQEATRSPHEIAQEIMCSHLGSGSPFFEAHILDSYCMTHVRKPIGSMSFDFQKDIPEAKLPSVIRGPDGCKKVVVKRGNKYPWDLYESLKDGRLDQKYDYVMGIDISLGMGASNSTVSVWCVQTRRKVMEFADANTPPYVFARLVVAAALWIGGSRYNSRPLLIWESNGPGIDFGRIIVKVFKYAHVYMDTPIEMRADKPTKRYGWHSSATKKEEALGILRRAYAMSMIDNPSDSSIREAKNYVYTSMAGGLHGIGPAFLERESSAAKKTHGDRVIADMLCTWALLRKGLRSNQTHQDISVPLSNTRIYTNRQAWRKSQARKARPQIRRFDFSRAG